MPSPRHLVRSAKRLVKRLARPVRQPWATRRRLAADLGRLGVRPGGVLIVHSSLSAVGYVPGGPAAVIGALADAVGPAGTLVLPTHTWEWVEGGLREFDARTTPSCVGKLTEVFRALPGAVRSLHPTHSVAALGPDAEALTAGHEAAPTPCGAGTPYATCLDRGGQILLLGAGLGSNTAFHTAEAEADLPYLMLDEPDRFVLVDQAGARHERAVRRHRPGVARRFEATEGVLA
ncbi:MAG: AAC(3) family N-acetyltransferase, partial [Gemmataceae bacterium]|nr:AAC(3) family N-acetyltransferase [Gemmataceae bacterium]